MTMRRRENNMPGLLAGDVDILPSTTKPPQLLRAKVSLQLVVAILLISATVRSEDLYFLQSAYAAGAGGTVFVHEVEVFNPASSPANLNVCWLPRGEDNSTPVCVDVTVDPNRATRFGNILNDVFGAEPDVIGALRVTPSSGDLQFHSRVINVSDAGTFGQIIPALPVSNALSYGEHAYVVHLAENDDIRANVGCVNALPTPIRINIAMYGGDGTLLETRTMDLGPWSNNQINRIFRYYAPVNGYVDVSTPTEGGAFYCYGSVLDNLTSDPRYEPAVNPSEDESEYYIPITFNTAESSSDLSLFSPFGDVTAEIDLLRTGWDNTNHMSFSVLVPGGEEIRYHDVLAEVFGHSGTAALRVSVSNGPPVQVSVQTSNGSPTGPMHQHVPALAASAQIEHGESAALIHLKEGGGFRTDVGFVNTSAFSIELELELHGELGNALGSIPIQVLPFGHYQLDSVFAAVGHPLVPVGFAIVQTTTPNGSFLAYATVTDLRTRDAYHVTANTLFVSVFGDGFESGDTSAWSTTVP